MKPHELRDDFAKAALVILVSPQWNINFDPHYVASKVYLIADALMLEREKGWCLQPTKK